MRKFLSAILFTFLLFFTGSFSCFSEEPYSRYQRSVYTENYLLEKEMDPQKSVIIPEYIGTFPFNVTVDIPAENKANDNTDENTIDQVIFSFTQDFFIKNPEFIISFIEITKENKLPYNCTVLLTADDEKTILESTEDFPCASDFYADKLYETNSTCSFVITDEDFFPSQIKTTGGGEISPMWIVRSVQNAFQANQKYINVQKSTLYHRKSNLFKEDHRLSAFTKNDIICTSFPLGQSDTDLKILDSLEKEVIDSRHQGGNTLYNVVSAKAFSIWINESLLTLIYLSIAAFALFSVYFSSFAYNAKNEAVFKDLSRTWFLTPAYIIIASLLLSLFQFIFSAAINSPVMYFSLKVIFTLCALFTISVIQYYYKFRISLSSISFQIFIICALNIFIFAFIDLSLMFVFIIEYVIALLARKSKRKIVAVIVLLAMVIPFLQSATSIYINIRTDKLSELFKTTFSKNLIFSLILIPFTFQWIRCILLFNLKDKSSAGNKAVFLFYGIAISSVSAILIFSIFLFGSIFTSSRLTSDNSQDLISVTESNKEEVLFEYSTSDNFDLVTHKIDISAGKEKQILRCLVTLSAESNPLYECNFNYSMKSPTEAQVEIPDGAEGTVSLIFSSDYGVPVHAKMEFFILTDELNAIHEIKEFDLTGKLNDGKNI